MADLSQRLSYGSIKVYLSAIRLYHLEHYYSDPLEQAPLLHYLCLAIKREQPSSKRKRLPILTPHLQAIKHQLSISSLTSHDKLTYWAAFTLAFYGFCRVSEFTSPSPSHFDPSIHLSLSDISHTPHSLTFSLHHSKTNQFGRTEPITVGRTDTPTCPIRAMSKYLRVRGLLPPGPLFVLSSGTYLTRKDVATTTKLMLRRAGFDPPLPPIHSPHSPILVGCL